MSPEDILTQDGLVRSMRALDAGEATPCYVSVAWRNRISRAADKFLERRGLKQTKEQIHQAYLPKTKANGGAND